MKCPPPRAVIDIGSNSVRLVIFDGPARAPLTRFNEKVMVGLGRGLADTGQMGVGPRRRAEEALLRFGQIVRAAGIDAPLIVATAAVRDASDGAAFVARLTELDLAPTVLTGEAEGRLSALGVLAGDARASGLVADLGGGSLELAELGCGSVGQAVSLPLGVLRIRDLARGRSRALTKALAQGLKAVAWQGARAETLHLVGGSFRALGSLDSQWRGRQPPALHGLVLAPERAAMLRRRLARPSEETLAALPGVASARRSQMPAAAALLTALVDQLQPSSLVISSTGLREGLLYDQLTVEDRSQRPAPRCGSVRGWGGGRLDGRQRSIVGSRPCSTIPSTSRRLRLASAHLAGSGWHANPSFRAERAAETALHGAWTGVGPRGRAIMAATLDACFGGGSNLDRQLSEWADAASLERARQWGLALRLAQRFSGGVESALGEGQLSRGRGRIELRLTGGLAAGEVVERRLRQLSAALGCEGVVVG